MSNSRIIDDKLVRYVPVDEQDGITTLMGEVILTKEEFLACYNAWVLGNAWEIGREVRGE